MKGEISHRDKSAVLKQQVTLRDKALKGSLDVLVSDWPARKLHTVCEDPILLCYKHIVFEIPGEETAVEVDTIQLGTTQWPHTEFVISTFQVLWELTHSTSFLFFTLQVNKTEERNTTACLYSVSQWGSFVEEIYDSVYQQTNGKPVPNSPPLPVRLAHINCRATALVHNMFIQTSLHRANVAMGIFSSFPDFLTMTNADAASAQKYPM